MLLQVYEAVSCMSQRQLKRAANLLLDSVATFTTYELFSYEECVFYAVSMAIVTLPRPDLRKKVCSALHIQKEVFITQFSRPMSVEPQP
jgi:26S proteasome regulatory subunit N7